MRLIVITMILLCCGYVMKAQKASKLRQGVASFYAHKFVGRKTATGEVFSNTAYTAACNKMKLGTYVKVTNTTNGNVVYVWVNDRMAPSNHRLIDLARIAAEKLGFYDAGTTHVKMEPVQESEGRTGIMAQLEKAGSAHANEL